MKAGGKTQECKQMIALTMKYLPYQTRIKFMIRFKFIKINGTNIAVDNKIKTKLNVGSMGILIHQLKILFMKFHFYVIQ
jgi:hypothetical protein